MRRRGNQFITAVSIAIVFGLLSGGRIAIADDQQIAQFIGSLAKSEKLLTNLMMEGGYVDEVRKGKLWESTQTEIKVRAWMNGSPGGLERVDVIRQVLPWVDGPSPFAESAFTVCWDGHLGKLIHVKEGEPGKTFNVATAETYNKRPLYFVAGGELFETGGWFSIYFYRAGSSKSLSSYLAEQLKEIQTNPETFATLSEVQYAGIKAIKISMGRRKRITMNWWLDPRKENALLSSETISYLPDGVERLSARYETVSLAEAATHIWYPAEAFYEYPRVDDQGRPDLSKPQRRMHYLATKVVANDPNFDDTIFNPPFPANYAVYDAATGKTTIIAPTTRKVD